MRQWIWIIPIATGISFTAYKSYSSSNNTLDTHMSPQEERSTGVHKLSPKERSELQKWINQHHYPKSGTKMGAHPTVSEVLGNGAYVKLSDNTLWLIHPNDRALTQSWITPANIEVTRSQDTQYPFSLKNTQTKSKVRATLVREIPRSPLTPSEPEPMQKG
jgi:hypothetical protein